MSYDLIDVIMIINHCHHDYHIDVIMIQLLEYAIPPAAAAAPAVSPKSPRLTHYPTANTLCIG